VIAGAWPPSGERCGELAESFCIEVVEIGAEDGRSTVGGRETGVSKVVVVVSPNFARAFE
jgi:hypothetical protein